MWFKKQSTETRAKAVAYYRHSAEDRQENSIPIQREEIKKFAKEHGIEIVKEFPRNAVMDSMKCLKRL